MVYWENYLDSSSHYGLAYCVQIIDCRAAEGCRVWLQGLAAGFGTGLDGLWPGFGQGLTRVWLKGLVSGIGCKAAGLQGC